MSEGFTCRGCGNFFFQAPKCVGCGAEKLYDSTVRLQGKEIEAQAARIAELEEIVKSAFTEGFYYGREEGKELGEFAGNGGDHRRYQYARDSIWYWERSETETALKGGKKE